MKSSIQFLLFRIVFIILNGLFYASCALDPLMNSSSNTESAMQTPSIVKYSDNPQVGVVNNRKYRHMTRKQLEEESELQAQAGSMWVPEGQGAYLFSQNKSRRQGDLLNIKLDGPSLRQVEVKVNVIKKLIKQLEDETQQRENAFRLASTNGEAPERGIASDSNAKAADANKAMNSSSKKEDKADLTEIQSIQTRIVEKLPDGNYRIKGQQPFMIDKKEYKLIMSGLIRPEDFSDEGVSSSKLIDSQIDVVSIRRGS